MKNEARLATKLYVATVWCNARQIEIELSERPFPLSSVGNRLRTRAELRFFEKEEPARSSRFDEPLRCKQENNVPLLRTIPYSYFLQIEAKHQTSSRKHIDHDVFYYKYRC